jgi:hypothetical protein
VLLYELLPPFIPIADWLALLDAAHQCLAAELAAGQLAEAPTVDVPANSSRSSRARTASAKSAPPPRCASLRATCGTPGGSSASSRRRNARRLRFPPSGPASQPWPSCGACNVPMTFFLQFAVPFWRGDLLAIFSCTSCARADALIPPDSATLGEHAGPRACFIRTAVASAVARSDAPVRVAFRRYALAHAKASFAKTKTGGVPHWLMEPELAMSDDEALLLQLEAGTSFETVDGAPLELFVGNQLYVFGHVEKPHLRLIVQRR